MLYQLLNSRNLLQGIPYCPGPRSEAVFSKLIDVTQCTLQPDGQHQAGDLEKSKTFSTLVIYKMWLYHLHTLHCAGRKENGRKREDWITG